MNELKRALPTDVEAWCKDVISRYFVLAGINNTMHWSAQLVAIMMRLDYTPKEELMAGNPHEGWGLADVHKHVSKELIADLHAEIELAEVDGRVTTLEMHDLNGQKAEGEIYVVEGGQMAYVDHQPEKVDLSKPRGESWGSW